MDLRIEPFIDGFIQSLKPHLSPLDREFFKLVIAAHTPSSFASPLETDKTKAAYFFRFGAAHLNVLLPVWILNGRRSTSADRYRIACTEDHSLILDLKEKLLYDPTIEILHRAIEHRAFWLYADWRDEVRARYRDELAQGHLKVLSLTERIEHIPSLYSKFTQFVSTRRLKADFPLLRYGLQLEVTAANVALIEMALAELSGRTKAA